MIIRLRTNEYKTIMIESLLTWTSLNLMPKIIEIIKKKAWVSLLLIRQVTCITKILTVNMS